MPNPMPKPLFPSFDELKSFELDEYPSIRLFLKSLPDELDAMKFWNLGRLFLLRTGKNKSIHTYNRFRNEVERFLNWNFLVLRRKIKAEDPNKEDIIVPVPASQISKDEFSEYAEFCNKPKKNWIGTVSVARFKLINGKYHPNSSWKPFKYQLAKSEIKRLKRLNVDPKIDKGNYKASQQSLQAVFTAIVAFFKYLIDENQCETNHAQWARKNCSLFVKDESYETVKRLSEKQWQLALDSATKMADENEKYERNLFTLAMMKTMFLRISELCENKKWSPTMGHFSKDPVDGYWWFKAYGKGKKIRSISVPKAFLKYLERYRLSRNLSKLPNPGDKEPLIHKLRGNGCVKARQMHETMQETFDYICDDLSENGHLHESEIFEQVSSHWLRHTGASMEIERGRDLKDLSMDLGHASMATTDTIYVQTEKKKRAESGKDRDV